MPDPSMSDIVLHTERLSKSYAGLRANHNLDLQLRRGEIHALIGPNGAGKTTLMRTVMGFLPVDKPFSGNAGAFLSACPQIPKRRRGRSFSYRYWIFRMKGNAGRPS